MKILLKWINEYVKINDLTLQEVTKAFLEIGFEAESITYLGESTRAIKTAKVISTQKLTEKLNLCSVMLQNKKIVSVVCGAPNVYNGMITAYAPLGSTIKGKTISIATFNGKKSEGMLCSSQELSLTPDNFDFPINENGILDFPQNTKIGENLDKLLGLDDYLIDLSITANRPDCQSIYGLCRELSVKLNRKLKPLNLSYNTIPYSNECMPQVSIQNKDLCPIYIGTRIKNVKIAPSNKTIRSRLAALGHKPINNIVDITNYVLIEIGQPLHAFDLANISEQIIIRPSNTGEAIKTLDGQPHTLKSNLIIADKNKPLAIAGIMGGEHSGVKSDTQDVFLESARFSREHIRLGSRALGIVTDSSKRFEKGVDFYSVQTGYKRALALIFEQNAGQIVDIQSIDGQQNPQTRTITLKIDQIEQLLGIKIPAKFIETTLAHLGFSLTKQKKELQVTIPHHREDIDNYTDLAEEIIRFYGYDKMESEPVTTLPMTKGGISKTRSIIDRIERICLAHSMHEIKNFSFLPPQEYKKLLLPTHEQIKIINPLSEDYSTMRTQLISGLLNTAALNQSRQNRHFRIFEIDNAFFPSQNTLPIEKKMLAALFCHENDDFFTLKSFVNALAHEFKLNYTIEKTLKPYLHPNLSADIFLDAKPFISFGKIHPTAAKNYNINDNAYLLEMDISLLSERAETPIKFQPLPKYPHVERDLAIVLDQGILMGNVLKIIEKTANSTTIICKASLIELYQGEQIEQGKKSALVRLKLTNTQKTLTEPEINSITTNVINTLSQSLDAKLRQ